MYVYKIDSCQTFAFPIKNRFPAPCSLAIATATETSRGIHGPANLSIDKHLRDRHGCILQIRRWDFLLKSTVCGCIRVTDSMFPSGNKSEIKPTLSSGQELILPPPLPGCALCRNPCYIQSVAKSLRNSAILHQNIHFTITTNPQPQLLES
jgi:hypothetical protein